MNRKKSDTCKGNIAINSRDRVDPSQTSTFDFRVSITPNLECDYIGIQQLSCEVGFTNIASFNNTLTFTYNAVQHTVTMPVGDYDPFQLATEISNLFTAAAGSPITLNIDNTTLICTISITPGDTISINLTQNTDVWYMQGFYPSTDLINIGPASSDFIAGAVVTRFYTKALYICVSGLIEDSSYYSNKILEPVLAVIPTIPIVETLPGSQLGSTILYEDYTNKVWKACRNIGTIKITVRDDRGRVVSNNGLDLLLVLYYM